MNTSFGQPTTRDRSRWTPERLSTLGLALALGLCALGAGGIHLAVLAPSALLVSAAGLFLVFASARGARVRLGWHASVAVFAWLGLALFCLVQCWPLPLGTLARVAPDSADIWARALHPFGIPAPARASLSLAPGRTLIEALKAAFYAAVFALGARLGQRRGSSSVAAIAFGLCVLVAAVSAAHALSSAQRLYGAYTPLDAYSIAPLLNANSRAGYLNLGFFCGLGLLFRAGRTGRAALIGLGLAFLATEILLCQSRAGTGALALGLLLAAALPQPASQPQPQRSLEPSRASRLGIVLAIATTAASFAGAARRSALRLDDHSLDKFQLFARAWQLAKDHLVFGVGRGAFGSVFAAYQGPTQDLIAEHAENLPLQWTCEWGLPVTLLAFAALGAALYPVLGRRTWSSHSARCALIGAGAVLGQNLFDLGLELPALGGLLALVLGGLIGHASELARDRGPRLRTLASTAAVCSVACTALALHFGIPAPSRWRHQLYTELARDPRTPSPQFWSDLLDASRHYPAEPYFPLLGAAAAEHGGRDPLPFIARALERNPDGAPAYLELARILHDRRSRHPGATSQALGALHHAIELDPRSMQSVLDLVSSWQLAPGDLDELVPPGAPGAAVLSDLADRHRDRPELELSWRERALERSPDRPELHAKFAGALLEDLQRGESAARCASARDACLERAEREARLAGSPHDSQSLLLEARILAFRGDPQRAEARLASGCSEFPADTACLQALFDLGLQNQSPRLAQSARAWIAAACTDSERCAQTLLAIARRFAAHQQWNVALGYYQRAAREAPSLQTWQALASAARQTGQNEIAAEAERHLAQLTPAAAPAAAISAASPSEAATQDGAREPSLPREPAGTEH
jgi:hypothetical protein